MKYAPQFPPDLWDELRKIKLALDAFESEIVQYTAPRAAPPKPATGMVAYADNVAWAPTGAAGWHGYQGGAWSRFALEPITATLSYQTAALSADVQLAVTGTWYSGPAVTVAAGTWLLIAHAHISRNATTAWSGSIQIHDGTNAVASNGEYGPSATGSAGALACHAIVAPAGSTTYTLRAVANPGSANQLLKAATTYSGSGNHATVISAVRIA